MISSKLTEELRAHKQDHVLQFYEAGKLSDEESQTLATQLEDLDLDYLESIFEASMKPSADTTSASIDPLDEYALLDKSANSDRNRWEELGLDAIRRGYVAALILSGGQGTRLGYPGPKGMYDIGLPSHKSLFQLFMERIVKLQRLASTPSTQAQIQVLVMTSPMNHDETVGYFASHDYFGLHEDQIRFFPQGTLPCFTTTGKLMLENSHKLATASDGNGGVYRALEKSGALASLQSKGVRYLHAFSVDNALCKAADPIFLGYCIDQDADCGNKVVWKAHAEERVGVVAKKNGKFCVVEYSEMDAEHCARRDENGELIFGAANICNHFYTLDFLQNTVLPNLSLQLHVAKKKIPIADADGNTMTPSENTGVKLESFIFDVFPLSKRMAVLGVPRESEFAPVKNPVGSASDSPETARAMLVSEAKEWLVQAAAADSVEKFKTKYIANATIEISPLVSYNGEGLQDRVVRLQEEAPRLTIVLNE